MYCEWAKEGDPVRFEDVIPRKWQAPGFVRATKMTPLAFYDKCKEHGVTSEKKAWELAVDLEDKGDRGLMAFMQECRDTAGQVDRVHKALTAKEKRERAAKTRVQILAEAAASPCTCCDQAGGEPFLYYKLCRGMLHKNKMDGPLQQAVYKALAEGRGKKRTVFIVGDSDCGKSFVLKGLTKVYSAHTRPDEFGSYPLADIIDSEIIFLNDFEFDDTVAKHWMSWQCLKNLLEANVSVTIAVPKNTNAKNEHWKGTAPVIGSAPQKVALYRKEKKVPKECRQMDNRITYFFADYSFLEDELRDCEFCVHCTGQLDMEGAPGAFLGAWEAPPPPGMLAQGQVAPPEAPRAQPGAEGERPQKRARTASCVLDELKDLAALRAQGALNPAEYEEMKQRLLRGP